MIQTAGQRPNPNRHRSFFDIAAAGSRHRLPRPRPDPGQPRRGPARLQRRHRRRRGLRAALPRPAHRRRTCPTRVARSYYGGAWSADSPSFFYTVHDEAYRPHQVWRHRLGTDRRRRRARAGGAGRAVRAGPARSPAAATWCVICEREPVDRARPGWSTPHAPESPPRSVGGRRHGVRLPRRARRRPTATGCWWSPTTTPSSSG